MLPKRMNLTVVALLAFVLSGSLGMASIEKAAPPTGKKITLALNLAEGDSMTLNMGIDMDMVVQAPDNNMDMKMEMGMDMDFEVLEVDSLKNHNFKTGFSRVTMLMGGPMSMSYDSADPASKDSPMAAAMAPLLGIKFTMKMTSTGELLEIGGLEDAPSEFRQQMMQTENQLGMVSAYPKYPVDNGDTWTEVIEQNQGGAKMVMDATYTLLDQQNGFAIVGVSGAVSGGLSGSFSGKMSIRIATGWVESGEIEMDAKGDEQGVPIDMKMIMSYHSK